MSDIQTNMSPLWCDGQVIHVADIRMDCLCRRYGGQTVDMTDIQTDTSCGWYDRQGSRMFQLNHTCDATPPPTTQVEIVV